MNQMQQVVSEENIAHREAVAAWSRVDELKLDLARARRFGGDTTVAEDWLRAAIKEAAVKEMEACRAGWRRLRDLREANVAQGAR